MEEAVSGEALSGTMTRPEDGEAKARLQAERLLARRRRSEQELRTALLKKAYAPETVDAVLAALRACGLVDDRAFAEAWVHDRQLLRPRSRFVLERELAAKGIAQDTARAVLDAMQDGDADRRLAGELARTWLRRYGHLPADVRARRLAGYLQRRGFSVSVALEAMRRAGEDVEDEG